MRINSYLIRDTCISLRDAVILVLSGCKTEFYKSLWM